MNRQSSSRYLAFKNIGINIVGNTVILVLRFMYQSHKEFEKNELCTSDLVMYCYLTCLLIKQFVFSMQSSGATKEGREKQIKSAEVSGSFTNHLYCLFVDELVVLLLIWSFGSSILMYVVFDLFILLSYSIDRLNSDLINAVYLLQKFKVYH